MAFCTKCGRPRNGAEKFCTGCGDAFPEPTATVTAVPQTPAAQPSQQQPDQPPGQIGRSMTVAIVAAVVILAAGGGAAYFLTHRVGAKLTAAASQQRRSDGTTQSASEPAAQPTPSITPTISPAPAASLPLSPSPGASEGLSAPVQDSVTLAPGIVTDARTSAVENFVIDYFTAINEHSYQAYTALLNPTLRADETPQAFQAGYRSTADSAATITAISAVSPGVTGATITFVSHQNRTDSATDSTCTDWNITLYLQASGTGYVIGPAPSGYHAAYHAC
jgi:hypothetical protein